ncbi:hypothetical protein HK097_002165 [Rhizophlyctis rosea]|uniref:Uncharacterized protein n=1 Tax=Rhizophlyctis rosea TaxID=64517 RepID=A0AAD5S576_9FUNG|nr:hypothetical protein HK097_002165 [Rhizophlyctis rosea]
MAINSDPAPLLASLRSYCVLMDESGKTTITSHMDVHFVIQYQFNSILKCLSVRWRENQKMTCASVYTHLAYENSLLPVTMSWDVKSKIPEKEVKGTLWDPVVKAPDTPDDLQLNQIEYEIEIFTYKKQSELKKKGQAGRMQMGRRIQGHDVNTWYNGPHAQRQAGQLRNAVPKASDGQPDVIVMADFTKPTRGYESPLPPTPLPEAPSPPPSAKNPVDIRNWAESVSASEDTEVDRPPSTSTDDELPTWGRDDDRKKAADGGANGVAFNSAWGREKPKIARPAPITDVQTWPELPADMRTLAPKKLLPTPAAKPAPTANGRKAAPKKAKWPKPPPGMTFAKVAKAGVVDEPKKAEKPAQQYKDVPTAVVGDAAPFRPWEKHAPENTHETFPPLGGVVPSWDKSATVAPAWQRTTAPHKGAADLSKRQFPELRAEPPTAVSTSKTAAIYEDPTSTARPAEPALQLKDNVCNGDMPSADQKTHELGGKVAGSAELSKVAGGVGSSVKEDRETDWDKAGDDEEEETGCAPPPTLSAGDALLEFVKASKRQSPVAKIVQPAVTARRNESPAAPTTSQQQQKPQPTDAQPSAQQITNKTEERDEGFESDDEEPIDLGQRPEKKPAAKAHQEASNNAKLQPDTNTYDQDPEKKDSARAPSPPSPEKSATPQWPGPPPAQLPPWQAYYPYGSYYASPPFDPYGAPPGFSDRPDATTTVPPPYMPPMVPPPGAWPGYDAYGRPIAMQQPSPLQQTALIPPPPTAWPSLYAPPPPPPSVTPAVPALTTKPEPPQHQEQRQRKASPAPKAAELAAVHEKSQRAPEAAAGPAAAAPAADEPGDRGKPIFSMRVWTDVGALMMRIYEDERPFFAVQEFCEGHGLMAQFDVVWQVVQKELVKRGVL